MFLPHNYTIFNNCHLSQNCLFHLSLSVTGAGYLHLHYFYTGGWSTLYNMDGLDQLLLGFFGISCLLLLIYGIIYVICLTCHSVGLMPSRFSNKVSSPATNINRYLHTLIYCVQDHYSKFLKTLFFLLQGSSWTYNNHWGISPQCLSHSQSSLRWQSLQRHLGFSLSSAITAVPTTGSKTGRKQVNYL